MPAANRDISIYQGDTYIHELHIFNSQKQPIPIFNRIYSGTIKKSRKSDTVVAIFSITKTDEANGVLQFSLASSISANLATGSYYYDLQENNNSYITTLLTGKAFVIGQVTYG
jgi:hypothetical protein